MIPKKKKIKRGSSIQSIVFMVLISLLLIIVVGFLFGSNFKINSKRNELLKEIENLQKEIEILETEKEGFQSGLLQTEDADYWEGKIREQGYKKQGEEVVVVLPPEDVAEEDLKERNFFDKIKETLGL